MKVIVFAANDFKFKKFKVCKTKTGNFCCIKKFRSSKLTSFGPGIVIYFQFIKYLAYVFSLFTIFSMPSFILYSSGNINKNSNTDIKITFSSLTLGNIGQCKTLYYNYYSILRLQQRSNGQQLKFIYHFVLFLWHLE